MSAFVLWAACAASAVFWAMRLGATPLAAPSHTTAVSAVVVPHGDLTRLFGAEPPPEAAAQPQVPALASRFHLLGVVAPRDGHAPAIALIAFDDKPPRAFRQGATLDGDVVLQSVQPRGVDIGPRNAPAAAHLELPPLAAAATGSLPPPMPVTAPPTEAPPAEAQPAPAPAEMPQQPVPEAQQPPPAAAEMGRHIPIRRGDRGAAPPSPTPNGGNVER
jgi:general secretion pathway protein C